MSNFGNAYAHPAPPGQLDWYFGYPSREAFWAAQPKAPKTVTIHDDTTFPIRYKRTDKPRIKKIEFGIYLCFDTQVWGKAYSPAAAYAAWLRNNFLPAPS